MSQTVNLGHVVGPGVPNGGTAGQVLKKNSGTNFDTSWSDNSAATIPMSGSDSTSIKNAMSKILPVITGTTNNSGYAIAAGEYFEANGGLYQATASIPVDSAWSSSATALTDNGAVNVLNSKITDITIMSNSAGTFSTLAELATILNTAVSSMQNFEIKRIRINCSATVYPFTNGYGYDVELYKFSGNTYIHANFYSGGKLPIYVGVKDASGWSFDELALNSKIGNLQFKYYPNVSFTFDNSQYGNANVSSIDSSVAQAKVIIPMPASQGTNLSCGALNAAKTVVSVMAPVSLNTSLNVNLLVII